MSDRTPSTDALETLGMIHFKPEHRDAIHLAVEPVKAGMSLHSGEKIGIVDGLAYPAGYNHPTAGKVKAQGIVDPFLPGAEVSIRGINYAVEQGQSFWFIMNPRMVTSLRHVWSHPDFPEA